MILATDDCDNLVITVCTNFNHHIHWFVLLSLYCSLWFLIHGRRERLFLLLSSSSCFWWGVPSHRCHTFNAQRHTWRNKIQTPTEYKSHVRQHSQQYVREYHKKGNKPFFHQLIGHHVMYLNAH